MRLAEQIATIETKADLVAFIEALTRDLTTNPNEWENATLERYLTALASWLEDSDGYYRNRGMDPPKTPSWTNVVDMLIAAKMYE
jgi:hypothetical protein